MKFSCQYIIDAGWVGGKNKTSLRPLANKTNKEERRGVHGTTKRQTRKAHQPMSVNLIVADYNSDDPKKSKAVWVDSSRRVEYDWDQPDVRRLRKCAILADLGLRVLRGSTKKSVRDGDVDDVPALAGEAKLQVRPQRRRRREARGLLRRGGGTTPKNSGDRVDDSVAEPLAQAAAQAGEQMVLGERSGGAERAAITNLRRNGGQKKATATEHQSLCGREPHQAKKASIRERSRAEPAACTRGTVS